MFRNYLGNNFFFWSDPTWSATVIYWDSGPFWAAGIRETFRARAENRKTQFPGARGTFGEKILPPENFLPKIAQLFYNLRFGRPDPQGREIAKYWFSRPFWPRAALGT